MGLGIVTVSLLRTKKKISCNKKFLLSFQKVSVARARPQMMRKNHYP